MGGESTRYFEGAHTTCFNKTEPLPYEPAAPMSCWAGPQRWTGTCGTVNVDQFCMHVWISSRYFPRGVRYPYCITPPICLFHLLVPSSLPLPSHNSTANEAEAALDPTTKPFKVAHQGFLGMLERRLQRTKQKTDLVCRLANLSVNIICAYKCALLNVLLH